MGKTDDGGWGVVLMLREKNTSFSKEFDLKRSG